MSAPIVVHACMTPNVGKVVLMLEEIGADYELRFVNILAGEQFGEPFRHLNANSKLPAITVRDDPSGEDWTLAESVAILLYLAERGPGLVPANPKRRATAIQWMMVQASGLGPVLGQLRHFAGAAPQPQDYASARFRSEAIRLFETFEARLHDQPWLGGADYGVADINLYPWLRDVLRYRERGLDFGFEAGRFKATEDWLGRILERPATARAEARMAPIEAATKAAMATASADDFDRLFGRGRWQRT